MERYVSRSLISCILWGFTGDSKLKDREDLGNFIRNVTTIPLPSTAASIIDFEVSCKRKDLCLHPLCLHSSGVCTCAQLCTLSSFRSSLV